MLSGVSDFFGLDIGTSTLRIVQLRGTGRIKSLLRYAHMPVDEKLVASDSKVDQQHLATIIKDFVDKTKVTTNNVAVGLSSSRVFTTMVDIDKLSPAELASTIEYQADALIPTPLDESKIDWAMVGDSPKEPNKVEVLLSSVSNSFIETRLDLLESIGLNVVAFEPDSMAMARAIIPVDTTSPVMVLDIGAKSTDLVISFKDAPRLIRAISIGTEAIIQAAKQNLSIEKQQAEQFVYKFGLSKDKLEGQIYNAIINTVDILVTETDKSIKFFQARYPNLKLERIIVTGAASSLPEFPLYIANRFGIPVEIGNAWRNISVPADKQSELLGISNQFGVAAGLAERNEK
jgi:type IV pilus assembly protein PilM